MVESPSATGAVRSGESLSLTGQVAP